MNVLPTQEEVRRIASTGKYKVIPVSCEILSDFTGTVKKEIRFIRKEDRL